MAAARLSCFNRTFLVLKVKSRVRIDLVASGGFNRTFLVLKEGWEVSKDEHGRGFNRTFLVLKVAQVPEEYRSRGLVLIAPFWY